MAQDSTANRLYELRRVMMFRMGIAEWFEWGMKNNSVTNYQAWLIHAEKQTGMAKIIRMTRMEKRKTNQGREGRGAVNR